MVLTSNPEIARQVRQLRNSGPAVLDRRTVPGFNYGMEGIQAGVRRVKLRYLEQWNAARGANAARSDAAIRGPAVGAPQAMPWGRHVHRAQAAFLARGSEPRVHYPRPIHGLDAWRRLGLSEGAFPEAERAADEVLSIPAHPKPSPADVEQVIETLRDVSAVSAAAPAPGAARRPEREHAAS